MKRVVLIVNSYQINCVIIFKYKEVTLNAYWNLDYKCSAFIFYHINQFQVPLCSSIKCPFLSSQVNSTLVSRHWRSYSDNAKSYYMALNSS